MSIFFNHIRVMCACSLGSKPKFSSKSGLNLVISNENSFQRGKKSLLERWPSHQVEVAGTERNAGVYKGEGK